MRQRFGLDDPLPDPVRQVAAYAVAQLDFGRSYAYSLPVTDVIASRAWPTLQLGLMSYAVGLLGVPLGVYAASRRGAHRRQRRAAPDRRRHGRAHVVARR